MKVCALDERGKAVDWWFMYKVPKLSQAPTAKGTKATDATGYEYAYFDPKAETLQASDFRIDRNEGALNHTLASVFSKPAATTGWILYNDEMPADADRRDDGNLGHSKGVIAFDVKTRTGFWLLHSWPKYADPGAKAAPVPTYGQTYLCISIDLDTAAQLALQMVNHQEPQVYLPHVPSTLPKSNDLYRLTQRIDPNAPADSDVRDYRSTGGLRFKVIAKNKQWNRDFWNDLVAPSLEVDLDVETWIRGEVPPMLDKEGVYRTYDIKYIDFRPLGAAFAWPETKDHAKWAISKKSNWVCVGDINRMVTQRRRGGGTIALQDAKLWKALKQTEFIAPPPGVSEAKARAILKQAAADAKKHHGTAG